MIDTAPIFIENMNQAKHTSMETLADGDMVQNFRQNMKFKIETDQANKRFNKNEDIGMNGINNDDQNGIEINDNKEEGENKFMLIKDFYLFSRFTKLFPHLFINGALDWTMPRPRMMSEREALDKML